jgi:hypothetical protein
MTISCSYCHVSVPIQLTWYMETNVYEILKCSVLYETYPDRFKEFLFPLEPLKRAQLELLLLNFVLLLLDLIFHQFNLPTTVSYCKPDQQR